MAEELRIEIEFWNYKHKIMFKKIFIFHQLGSLEFLLSLQIGINKIVRPH